MTDRNNSVPETSLAQSGNLPANDFWSKLLLRPIYTVQFCRMQPPYDTLTTRLRHKKRCRIWKHVLKPYDSRVVAWSVVRRSHATKSYRVNRPLLFAVFSPDATQVTQIHSPWDCIEIYQVWWAEAFWIQCAHKQFSLFTLIISSAHMTCCEAPVVIKGE